MTLYCSESMWQVTPGSDGGIIRVPAQVVDAADPDEVSVPVPVTDGAAVGMVMVPRKRDDVLVPVRGMLVLQKVCRSEC